MNIIADIENQDILRRFIFEDLGIRGEWVRLQNSWQTAKAHQSYPPAAEALLGQALAAVTLLSATIKFKGSLILQAQGQGPIRTLVAQATQDRNIRGLVHCGAEVPVGDLSTQFGEGYIVLTIETEQAEPYQGIAPLVGDNFAQALENYFMQSEQLPTRLWLFANQTHAAGLFLQQLPSAAPIEDAWEKITVLGDTVTAEEMFTLPAEEMLYRLFNEDQLRLFAPENVNFVCRCSSAKIEHTLYNLGRDELEQILQEQENIEVHCEFCNRHYVFDRVDVERILLQGLAGTNTTTQH